MDDVSRGLLILGFSVVWLCFQILCYGLIPFYLIDLIRICERTNHGFLFGLINVICSILLGLLVLPLPFPLAAWIMLYLTNKYLINHFSFTQEYRESFQCVFKKAFNEVVAHSPSSSSSSSSNSSSSSGSIGGNSNDSNPYDQLAKDRLEKLARIRSGLANNGDEGTWFW